LEAAKVEWHVIVMVNIMFDGKYVEEWDYALMCSSSSPSMLDVIEPAFASSPSPSIHQTAQSTFPLQSWCPQTQALWSAYSKWKSTNENQSYVYRSLHSVPVLHIYRYFVNSFMHIEVYANHPHHVWFSCPCCRMHICISSIHRGASPGTPSLYQPRWPLSVAVDSKHFFCCSYAECSSYCIPI